MNETACDSFCLIRDCLSLQDQTPKPIDNGEDELIVSPISDVLVLVGMSLDLINAQDLFRVEIADSQFKCLLVEVIRGPEDVESAALVFHACVQVHQHCQKGRSTGDDLVCLIIGVEPRS